MKGAFAVLAVGLAALAPSAFAQSVDGLYEQLAEIDARYGFSPEPDLSDEQWEAYNAELDAIYDRYEADFVAVESMYAEYGGVVEKIAATDEKGAAIDARYGIAPYPELSDEQWSSYEAEINAAWEEADRFWQEYEAGDPEAGPDRERLEAIYARMSEIDERYGIAQMPELSAEEWESYGAEWDALEAERAPYFDELERIQAPYQGALDRLERAAEDLRAIDARYGIDAQVPELSAQEWEAYESERAAVQASIDELEAERDAAYRDALSGIGVTLPSGDDPGFDEDLAALASSHPQMLLLGDPGAAQKDEAYAYLEGIAPQIREVFERHGYEFGVSTAAQFEELDRLVLQAGGWR